MQLIFGWTAISGAQVVPMDGSGVDVKGGVPPSPQVGVGEASHKYLNPTKNKVRSCTTFDF